MARLTIGPKKKLNARYFKPETSVEYIEVEKPVEVIKYVDKPVYISEKEIEFKEIIKNVEVPVEVEKQIVKEVVKEVPVYKEKIVYQDVIKEIPKIVVQYKVPSFVYWVIVIQTLVNITLMFN